MESVILCAKTWNLYPLMACSCSQKGNGWHQPAAVTGKMLCPWPQWAFPRAELYGLHSLGDGHTYRTIQNYIYKNKLLPIPGSTSHKGRKEIKFINGLSTLGNRPLHTFYVSTIWQVRIHHNAYPSKETIGGNRAIWVTPKGPRWCGMDSRISRPTRIPPDRRCSV